MRWEHKAANTSTQAYLILSSKVFPQINDRPKLQTYRTCEINILISLISNIRLLFTGKSWWSNTKISTSVAVSQQSVYRQSWQMDNSSQPRSIILCSCSFNCSLWQLIEAHRSNTQKYLPARPSESNKALQMIVSALQNSHRCLKHWSLVLETLSSSTKKVLEWNTTSIIYKVWYFVTLNKCRAPLALCLWKSKGDKDREHVTNHPSMPLYRCSQAILSHLS